MYESAVRHIIWHHYTARELSLSLSVIFLNKITTSLHLGIWICASFMCVVCVCLCLCVRVCVHACVFEIDRIYAGRHIVWHRYTALMHFTHMYTYA